MEGIKYTFAPDTSDPGPSYFRWSLYSNRRIKRWNKRQYKKMMGGDQS